MIIVSQNKTKLINFEKINYIQASKIDESKSVIEINYSECEWNVVGYYKTEARAKEVLQEIAESYKFDRCGAVGPRQAVYKMPKE